MLLLLLPSLPIFFSLRDNCPSLRPLLPPSSNLFISPSLSLRFPMSFQTPLSPFSSPLCLPSHPKSLFLHSPFPPSRPLSSHATSSSLSSHATSSSLSSQATSSSLSSHATSSSLSFQATSPSPSTHATSSSLSSQATSSSLSSQATSSFLSSFVTFSYNRSCNALIVLLGTRDLHSYNRTFIHPKNSK
ncbi:hypothetical protein ACOMHN_055364 [Nucella lapillus]